MPTAKKSSAKETKEDKPKAEKKDTPTKKEKILGIDLGTSNSAAAVMIGGKPEIIPAAEGVFGWR